MQSTLLGMLLADPAVLAGMPLSGLRQMANRRATLVHRSDLSSPFRCVTFVVLMAHDTRLLHVYGWRHDAGPYYIGNVGTVAEGIPLAEDALKDRRRGFTRAEIKDVRAYRSWRCDSNPASVPSAR
jgi:hypothetical protein